MTLWCRKEALRQKGEGRVAGGGGQVRVEMSSCRVGKNRELKPCIQSPTEGDDHGSPRKAGGAGPSAGREVVSPGSKGLTPPGAQGRQSGFLSGAGTESFYLLLFFFMSLFFFIVFGVLDLAFFFLMFKSFRREEKISSQ